MNDKIKILVIEDEETWVLSLQALLSSLGFEVINTASTLANAIEVINSTDFDLALVDINIEGTNSGIALGQLIKSSFKKPFIFITASTESHTLQEAAKAKPSGYLLKPADRNSLYITIQNAIENFVEQKDVMGINVPNEESFFIKKGKKYLKVFWKNIVSLTSDQKYTVLEVANNNTECYIRSSLQNTIKHIIPIGFKNNFVQINRAQYINIQFIEELNNNTITLSNKSSYEVSDNYLGNLKSNINVMS